MKVNEFIQTVKESYYKQFPKSHINVSLSTNLCPSIGIVCYLSKDNTEVANGIINNDMFHVRMSVARQIGHLGNTITNDDVLPDDLELELYSKSYTIKPKNRYHVYDSLKLPFRKTKGNSDKLVKTLDGYFKKLKDSLENSLEKDLIHDNYKELLISKIR